MSKDMVHESPESQDREATRGDTAGYVVGPEYKLATRSIVGPDI